MTPLILAAVLPLLPAESIAGYEVSYGSESGKYTEKVDVGLVTEVTFTGLPQGPCFAVVTAYDATGRRGSPSPEVSTFISPLHYSVVFETTDDMQNWSVLAEVPINPLDAPQKFYRARIQAIKPE